MAEGEVFQGEMDPELASLLGTALPGAGAAMPVPDFSKLFNDEGSDDESPESRNLEDVEINLTERAFPPVIKKLETVPHNGFMDAKYYTLALSGEGDIAQRVHTLLQKYLNAKDPKDRGVYRQQFISPYWEFLSSVARKAPGKIPEAKKYLLRFGILHPTFLNEEMRDFFSKIVINNELSVPVYYLDEWFKAVGTGLVRNSTTDEVKVARSNSQVKLQQLLEKTQGKRDTAKSLLQAKNDERLGLEAAFIERTSLILEHTPLNELPSINAGYSESQRRLFGEVQELMKQMLKADRDTELFLRDYYQADADVQTLQEKIQEDEGQAVVDVQALGTEFETIRQMAKMTIGRQGNHFPVLSSEYFRSGPNDVAYRENVIATLAWVESIDPEVFCRYYKSRMNRIAPYVVLIPSYGDLGICWEPFDRFNRATSRGRIALPLYPKSLAAAVLGAVADLRWQVAKEKASYYWMEEGLTGYYYQWFTAHKLKGDVKEYFIQDYILWITKESEGIQKLDKEIRGIFWRYMPFSQPVKEKLKTRSFTYQDLYQRDLNRAMSDGY
ncbi:MAG: hypothetical protein LBD37_10525 [Treponema sp.]|jgi:hypothetical protein|nr:hypothetical protein [Treponema sp.]